MNNSELKVLLIEDNAGDAFLIKFYLSESHVPSFQFFHAENMKTADDLLSKNNFDIILMDLNLPDSVGVDTIRKTLEKYPNNLVIVLTGLVDDGKTGLETVRFGAQDFLVKGKFDGKLLISSIMFAYERFHLNKELSNVSSELNKGEERFANIETLFNAGYLEADLAKSVVYQSNNMLKLLNLPQEKQYITFEEAEEYLENIGDAKKIIEPLWSQAGVHEVEVKHKNYEGKLRFRWHRQGDDKVIGIVQPL